MQQRGRKSSEGLSVVSISPQERSDPPPPPDRLDAEEAAIWRAAILAMSPDCGTAALHLLELYCTEVITAQRLGAEMRGLDVMDPAFRKLSRMHASATTFAARLATKLRLLPRG
jgi:phage terminase small subunit